MNEYRMVDEQEIDLLDFLKSMLEQWRGCVIVGLICMLVAVGVRYSLDMKAYNSAVEAAAVSAENAEQSAVIENNALLEKAVAATNPGVALNYYVAWKQYKDSYDGSILMKLDATNVRTLGLDYILKCEEAGSDYVASYYGRLGTREDFTESLSKALGEEGIPDGFISDIVEVSATGSETGNGGYILIKIKLPEEADAAEVEKAVTSYLSSASGNNAEVMGHHDISLVSSGVSESFDNGVVNAQSNAVSNIESWKNKFLNLYKTLTADEKKEVDNVIASVETGEMSYQDVREEYSAQKSISVNWNESSVVQKVVAPAEDKLPAVPSFSIKYAAIGFALGIFAYAGCAFALLVLIRRFRNGEEAASALGLRSYGDIYEYPYHGFAAFLHDKKVYAWRHKKASDAAQVAAAIGAKAEHGAIKSLTCVILGDAGKAGQECIEEIVKKASGTGVKIDVKKAPEGLASISEEEIGKFSPVLVTVVSGKTHPFRAAELLSRLNEYDIPVFGMNFIEK